jgi:hypothetical protein
VATEAAIELADLRVVSEIQEGFELLFDSIRGVGHGMGAGLAIKLVHLPASWQGLRDTSWPGGS